MLPAYWLFLAFMTHLPRPEIPGRIPQSDKVLHLVAFGLLALLFWHGTRRRGQPPGPRFVWVAAAVLGAYACIDEYTQQFVGRSTSLIDLAANLSGIAIVLAVLERRRRRQSAAERGETGLEQPGGTS